jgi:pyruvate kinase
MKQILCTLGPASMNERVIRRLEDCGATLFRINLSHTNLDQVAPTVGLIKKITDVPICLDTEGAQIRTGPLVDGEISVRDNSIVRIHRRRVPGDDKNFNLYPADIIDVLEPGDFLSIDFNAVLVQVIGRDESNAVQMLVLNGGKIGQNKAVTLERPVKLPPLTAKDRGAIEIGRGLGLRHFALSFANHGEDVEEIRAVAGEDAFIISKIESRNGLANMDAIAARSNALLIDRGDLSREVPIERLPATQKSILRRGREAGVPVYVATNLLESMVTQPAPTRAEVNDIYNTLLDGADGLVLAAETAIGAHPIACAAMISRMIQQFENREIGDSDETSFEPISQLIAPHGGELVQQVATDIVRAATADLPTLAVSREILLDCEQITNGTYSPLRGFMDRDTLESVLDKNSLSDGTTWTLPVTLQAAHDQVQEYAVGDRVALTDGEGEAYAVIDISEIYTVDLDEICVRWYGTNSKDHPGVARTLNAGDHFVGGDVTLLKPVPSAHRHFQLTPQQTRFVFARLGWSRVVAFHGRNPAHRAHEAIQHAAIERTHADGLYINPVLGPKKAGDFLPAPIMRSYQTMLEFGCYPKGKVVLGGFATYSRYAGPREAVFTALCRKNMGCSHFIIGRDHTGVGDFYAPDANRLMFDALGDLGIEPVFFDTVGYDEETQSYNVDATDIGTARTISGTELRETIRAGERVPDWFMRDIVQDVLLDDIEAKRQVFYE